MCNKSTPITERQYTFRTFAFDPITNSNQCNNKQQLYAFFNVHHNSSALSIVGLSSLMKINLVHVICQHKRTSK